MTGAQVATLIGSIAAIVGMLATAISVFRKALKDAVEKGKMEQRLNEVEEDVSGAFDKIRKVQEQADMQFRTITRETEDSKREIAKIGERLNGIEKSQSDANQKLDRLIELHMPVGGGQH